MKNINTLFTELEKLKNEKGRVIDLTKKIDSSLPVYSEPGYSDPALKIREWCTVEEKGFSVSEITFGTQTGTHIDAPSHFVHEGAGIGSLDSTDMFGRYFYIDLNRLNDPADVTSSYNNESVIFLNACSGKAVITDQFFAALLSLKAKLWVLAGECEVSGRENFYFHKKLLSSGRYLVEDLDLDSAKIINRNGFIIALPLRLTDVSGSPCRVLAVME